MLIHQRRLVNWYKPKTKLMIWLTKMFASLTQSLLVAFVRHPQLDKSVSITRSQRSDVLVETKSTDLALMSTEFKQRRVDCSLTATACWWRLPDEQIAVFSRDDKFVLLYSKATIECWRLWQGNPVSLVKFLVGAKVVNSFTFLWWFQQTTAIVAVLDTTNFLIGR